MKTRAFSFRILPFVFALVFLFQGLCSPAAYAEQSLSGMGAQSYCLMDAGDQSILAQKNGDLPLPMASTTKIMTAVVILESCDVNTLISVSPKAVGIEGSSIYLQAGEKIRIQDLLYALMLESANDAAVALALACCESTELFAEKMNEKAKALGMANSFFCNPSGLTQEGHCASARDMAVLMAYAMKNPLFRRITATKSIRIPMAESTEYRYLSNHNRLLSKYSYCIGGKTGYTIAAGRCLVSVSNKDGVELIAVTLNDGNDWNDHVRLFEYGFAQYSKVTLCQAKELEYTLPVVGGIQSSVTVYNTEGITRSLRSQEGIVIQWELPFFLYAPITVTPQEGSNVPLPLGKALFYQNGVLLGEVWLYPSESVSDYTPPTWWEKILMFFGLKD